MDAPIGPHVNETHDDELTRIMQGKRKPYTTKFWTPERIDPAHTKAGALKVIQRDLQLAIIRKYEWHNHPKGEACGSFCILDFPENSDDISSPD